MMYRFRGPASKNILLFHDLFSGAGVLAGPLLNLSRETVGYRSQWSCDQTGRQFVTLRWGGNSGGSTSARGGFCYVGLVICQSCNDSRFYEGARSAIEKKKGTTDATASECTATRRGRCASMRKKVE